MDQQMTGDLAYVHMILERLLAQYGIGRLVPGREIDGTRLTMALLQRVAGHVVAEGYGQ